MAHPHHPPLLSCSGEGAQADRAVAMGAVVGSDWGPAPTSVWRRRAVLVLSTCSTVSSGTFSRRLSL